MMIRILIVSLALTLIAGLTQAEKVAVTVYNSNLGVVSETRTLDFDKGTSTLKFTDVPAAIDPNSVRFEVVGGAQDVSIFEQNYAFDLVGPEQMYARYIDQTLDITDEEGNMYTGTLLAYSGGAIILQEKSGSIKIVSMDNVANVAFPVLPDGLVTRPTLNWNYQAESAGSRECRVTYQTRSIFWTAEYVGLLDKDDKLLGLSGWASINNTSGKTYNDAVLKLVAGDIHRPEPERFDMAKLSVRGGRSGEATYFDEKSFFEYHLYTLPREATIADKEIKQISLFEPASTGVKKVFKYEPEKNASQVNVSIVFKNSKESGLGMPLPAGRVRMFKADDDGSAILIGEDNIKHTPEGEEVSLTVGYAFDIVAEETVLDRRRISKTVEEIDMQVEMRNRKDEPVQVEVEKRLYGFWDILNTELEYTIKDASTMTFTVSVPAKSTTKVNYTVRLTQR